MKDHSFRWQDWVTLFAGIWLFINPWLFGYYRMAYAWDAFLFGAVLFVFSIWALSDKRFLGRMGRLTYRNLGIYFALGTGLQYEQGSPVELSFCRLFHDGFCHLEHCGLPKGFNSPGLIKSRYHFCIRSKNRYGHVRITLPIPVFCTTE